MMKIESIRTYVLHAKLGEKSFAYSQNWYNSRTTAIVEIRCDDGFVGFGECFGPAGVNSTIIKELYAPQLIGRNPLDREVIWMSLYNRFRDHGQKGVMIEALSGIDIALWDIAGKHFGVPIHQLLGRSFRNELSAYATCLYRTDLHQDIESMIHEVQKHIEDGFTALKLKIGFGLRFDVEVVSRIREAVGEKIGLMIDANHAYDVTKARTLCNELNSMNILWFEEPIVPEDIDGYKFLRQCVDIPLAAGEAEYTRYGCRQLIRSGGIDILQPDACTTGGLTEALKIADMADAFHLRVNPHVWGTGIAIAAGIHFGAMIAPCPPALVLDNEPMLEMDRSPNPLREQLVDPIFNIINGKVTVPTKPGLGIEINRDILEYYAVK
jgi:D-galactarolactone cycloisomerase